MRNKVINTILVLSFIIVIALTILVENKIYTTNYDHCDAIEVNFFQYKTNHKWIITDETDVDIEIYYTKTIIGSREYYLIYTTEYEIYHQVKLNKAPICVVLNGE